MNQPVLEARLLCYINPYHYIVVGNQAMVIYTPNYQACMDHMAHVLHYPQKPLFTTWAMELLNFQELPSGVNCKVAIMIVMGNNHEYSLIINQSAIYHELLRSFYYICYIDQEKASSVGLVNTLTAKTFE